MKRIGILTYNRPHRKTYDTLCLIKAKGYSDVTVFARPFSYIKKRQPCIVHRPEIIMDIPTTRNLCRNFGYEYYEGDYVRDLTDEWKGVVFLLCGAGLLPDTFTNSFRIVNSHPGYSPDARGLDAYKWSIYYGLPVGVTTHILGEYVDAGEVIERRIIPVQEYDTFHSLAQRVYENEIDMLVGAIERIDDIHTIVLPDKNSEAFRRMPEALEKELFDRFQDYKVRFCRRQSD